MKRSIKTNLARLALTLAAVMLTTTAWAQTLVASPTEGGTISFVSNNDHNNLIVTANGGYHIDRVVHIYELPGGSSTQQNIDPDYMTGYYIINSSVGGTVTAYFVANGFTDVRVGFNFKGHGNTVYENYTLGQTVNRPADPTAEGLVFLGWFKNSGCTDPYDFNTPLDNTLPYNLPNQRYNLTLYALWAKTSCTVTIDGNGGEGTMTGATLAGGTSYSIPSCGFTKYGYKFTGWATAADGAVVYQPGDNITLMDDLTLYAKWSIRRPVGSRFEVGGWTYQVTGISPFTVGLYKGYGATGAVTIPSTVNDGYVDYLVTSIGLIGGNLSDDPFDNNVTVTSVTIPASVTTIGNYAFYYCSGLTTITIPNSVTSIGDCAFYHCSGLTNITIPNSVTSIGNSAFQNCTGLTTITIPRSVTSIEENSFSGCVNITDVYCYADPALLTWNEDCNDFKEDKATLCHVFDEAAFDAKWNKGNHAKDVRVTFVGDLATVPFNINEVDGVNHLACFAGMTLPVQFKRKFDTNTNGEGKASTICLPFSCVRPDGVGTFATFDEVTVEGGEYVVKMKEVTASTLTAGVPYMFKPSTGSELTFSNASFVVPTTMTAGTATKNDWQFKGTYTKMNWPDGQTRLYGFAGNNYYHDNGDQIAATEVGSFRRYDYGSCAAFRCYLWAPDPSAARGVRKSGSLPATMKVVLVRANGTPTAIGTMDTHTGEITFSNEWYSLDGSRLDGQPTKKGLYINNGKIIAIK